VEPGLALVAGASRRSRNAWLDRRSGPACSQLASSSGALSPRQRAALHCSGTTIICKDPERVVGDGTAGAGVHPRDGDKETHLSCSVRSLLCTMRLHAIGVRQESKDAGGDPPATYPHLPGVPTRTRVPLANLHISRPTLLARTFGAG
jgi:hypothetical protein